jgi:predicted GNAT superfamily acetyltransferase
MSPATATRPVQELSLRKLDGPEEFQRAEQVQREAWGYSDLDVVPGAVFSVARNFGGQALGAWDGKRMVGFALSFGVADGGYPHLHSHMVGVVPEYQNRGLGRLIKLAQREDALSRGIDQIAWTFDPLQVRNAYFNIARLGGVGVRFLPNLYGMTSSPLHGGMPTDRLLIEWNLTDPNVDLALNGTPRSPGADAVEVAIPAASSDVPIALRLAGQTKLREELMGLFDEGYVITGFERKGDAAVYVMERDRSGLRRSNED